MSLPKLSSSSLTIALLTTSVFHHRRCGIPLTNLNIDSKANHISDELKLLRRQKRLSKRTSGGQRKRSVRQERLGL
jgi:hypothetical protein